MSRRTEEILLREMVDKIWRSQLELGNTGPDTNFWCAGGSEQDAAAIAKEILQKSGLRIAASFFAEYPHFGHFIDALSALPSDVHGAAQNSLYDIPKTKNREVYELSAAQKRMWFQSITNEDKTAYNMPAAVRIRGRVDKDRFQRAFQGVVDLHEAFRTSFHRNRENREPIQKIADQINFKIAFLTADKPEDMDLQAFIRPFQLDAAPLLRVFLIEFNEEDHIMVLDMHHIISDGTSMSILMKDFLDFYFGNPIEAPSITYKDYVYWQKHFECRREKQRQDSYWRERLGNRQPQNGGIPADFTRPALRTNKGETVQYGISPELTDLLQNLGIQRKTTLNMVLLSLFFLLLYKCSGKNEISIGMPITGRRHSSLSRVIGMFVNMLVIHMEMHDQESYLDFLDRVRNSAVAAYANQDTQFEDLVDQLRIERKANQSPLFDFVFVLQEIDMPDTQGGPLQFEPYHIDRSARFDMVCTAVKNTDQELHFTVKYWSELYRESTVRTAMEDVEKIAIEVLKNPNSAIRDIQLPEQKKNTSAFVLDAMEFRL